MIMCFHHLDSKMKNQIYCPSIQMSLSKDSLACMLLVPIKKTCSCPLTMYEYLDKYAQLGIEVFLCEDDKTF